MNKKILSIITILVLILLATIYLIFKNDSYQIVTLEPDNIPAKKRPKEAGGVVIANADSLIYKQDNRRYNNVIILPDPEAQIEFLYRDVSKNVVVYNDSIDDILNNIDSYEEIYNSSIENAKQTEGQEEEEEESGEIILPNVISTRDAISNAHSKDQQEPKILVKNTNLIVTQAEESRFNIDSKAMSDNNRNNQYKIQLSLAVTEEQGKADWERIKKKYSQELSGSELILKKFKTNDRKIFYLVMAGPYSSLSSAKYVCRKLISRQQNCIVIK